MSIALNWHDLEVNGEPAWRRALQGLVLAVNRLEAEQAIALHLVEKRLATLEFLVSEELMREMLASEFPTLGAERRPVVVELAREVAQLREDLTALAGGTQTDAGLRIGWLTQCTGDATSPNQSPATRNGTNGTGALGASMGGGERCQK